VANGSSSTPTKRRAGHEPIPEVGEHNEKLLAELGYVETKAPGQDGATQT
jgi:hypothetical protein